MASGKKSFVLYCDIIHTVRKMPKDKAGELFMTILGYVNDEDPDIIDDILIDLVFEPIKQQLKRDLKKWEEYIEKQRGNGQKGGRPHKPIETLITQAFLENPVQPKKADNVNVSVNDSVTVISSINSNNSEHWDSVKKRWLSGFTWKEKVCRDFDILMPEVEKNMLEFLSGIELKEDYKNIQGLKSHFVNWYKKHKTNGKSTTKRVGKTIEFDRP